MLLKRLRYLLAVALAVGIVVGGGGHAFADSGVPVNVNITKFQILNLNKEEVHTIYQSDRFYLAMDWDASAAGTSIHEGDYFDITLPDNMKFPSGTTAQDFDLKDVDGNVVAKAHVTPGPGDVGGTVHVTFTKAVENKYNVKGTIYLAAQFDETKIIKDAENVFTITVNSQAVSGSVIVQGAKPLQDEPLAKWGKPVPGHEDQAEWNVRINHKKANLPNAVISDSLSGGNGDERYIEDSFKLLEVEFNEYGSIVQEIQTIDLTGKLQLAPDGRSFTINLGNVNGKQYRLYYKSTYHAGTVLKNKATLDASSAHEEISYSYQSAESGGTAGGDLASKIKLTKVDGDDNSIPLKNAVFTVTRPDGTTFELTTGEDGTVTSGVLVQGTYKVKEKTPPDGYELNGNEYTLEVTPTGGALKTICDRPIKTSASVTKRWVGPEGGEVTAHLLADGVDTGKELKLNAGNNWTGSFDNLRKYKAGTATEIVYTVKEDPVANYDSDVVGSMSSGFTITNTNTETVDVPVEKRWVGPKGSEVTAHLLADGVDTGKELKLNAGNNWTGSFDNLRKYKAGTATEIVYTVKEDPVANYDSDVVGSMSSGFTITNTNTETVDVPVEKRWVGPKGSEVTVRLLADGTDTGRELRLNEGNGWKGGFDGLPKYNADGSEVAYSVTEAEVAGVDSDKYETAVAGDAASGFTITNTNTETVEVSGAKSWDDDNDRDGVRPASITVNLMRDGAKADSKTVTPDPAGTWAYSFTGLPKYDPADGHEYAYAVTEEAVPNYATEVNDTDIVNSYTPGKTSVTVTKAWADANNRDGIRPASVKAQLYANSKPLGEPVELSDANGWTHTWTGLFMKEAGKDVAYEVKEVSVPKGYEASVAGDAKAGYTLTNAHEPETVSIPVVKKWVGGEGGEVTIHLLADGHDTGKSLKLNAGNGWKGSFNGLPAFEGGERIAYTVSEDAVEGYSSKIEGDASKGFTVTNTRGDKPKAATRLPQTGDAAGTPALAALAASGLAVAAGALLRRREG
ncbi:Cna B-type domain-containing protein [Olsenella uli]|uniref:Cna B-type domain-containing protein n=1 Tax=Olsenella uli TaxID=133926 RepID=UPI0028D518E5|nr:Cna B-type domain-containing protein [Olsenella uli]